jgi:uncharacterized protein (TIGR03067 family)
MWLRALGVIVAGLLLAADEPKGGGKKDQDQLQGTWVATSGENGGAALDDDQVKGMKFEIKGDKYTYTSGDYTEKGTLKVEGDKNPKAINLHIEEGQGQGEDQRGIYELKGDTFKVCFAQPGKDRERPKEFKTTADNGHLLIVLKREKS